VENRAILLPPSIEEIAFDAILENPLLFQSYYLKNIPVIIKNALDSWPALHHWTPEYLSQHLK